MGEGRIFLQKGPSSLPTSVPSVPKTFDVIESLFAAFWLGAEKKRAFRMTPV